MEINLQKEEFSYAYIRGVATVAGCVFQGTAPPLDGLGIDLILTGLKSRLPENFPILYVLVKCNSRGVINDDIVPFPLSVKNYNDLRVINRYPPIIFIVVVVPEKVEEWLLKSESSLCFLRCGYWLSLAGADVTTNQDNITVSIPRKNMFNPQVLEGIMEKVWQGDML